MPRDVNQAVEIQRKYYTDTAARYEGMHGQEAVGDPFHTDFVVATLRMLAIRSVLDVGTASGRTLRILKTAIPELFICGIEPVAALLDEATKAGNAESGAVIQGKGDALPFADSSFDAVCEFAILHHVAEPEVIIGEMLRVARKAVIISDSNRFGQGPMWMRSLKLTLYKIGLWGAFNYLRTAGKKYQITEGDGLAYSYSVYDNFDQLAAWADRVIIVTADKTRPTSWMHPLLTSGGVILCAIRDR